MIVSPNDIQTVATSIFVNTPYANYCLVEVAYTNRASLTKFSCKHIIHIMLSLAPHPRACRGRWEEISLLTDYNGLLKIATRQKLFVISNSKTLCPVRTHAWYFASAGQLRYCNTHHTHTHTYATCILHMDRCMVVYVYKKYTPCATAIGLFVPQRGNLPTVMTVGYPAAGNPQLYRPLSGINFIEDIRLLKL